MTVIAAVEEDGVVYLAGDRCLTRGNRTAVLAHPKIAELTTSGRNPRTLVVGVCGTYGSLPGLFTATNVPSVHPRMEPWVWLQQCFAPWLANHLLGEHKGHAANELEGCMLVAYAARLWQIDGGLSVCPIASGRPVAIGSGGQFAEGAMQALRALGSVGPDALVRAGVEAACSLDAYCCLPVDEVAVGAPPRRRRRNAA